MQISSMSDFPFLLWHRWHRKMPHIEDKCCHYLTLYKTLQQTIYICTQTINTYHYGAEKIEYTTLHLIVFCTIAIIGEHARPYYTLVETSSAATSFWWYAPLSKELSISICKWCSDNSFLQQ